MVSIATYTSWMRDLKKGKEPSLQLTLDLRPPGEQVPVRRLSQNTLAYRTLLQRKPVGQRCQVPRCSTRKCRLQTHLEYKPQSVHDESASDDTASSHSDHRETSETPENTNSMMVRSMDARPVLPLDDLDAPHSHELFHIFFTSEMEHILRLTEPPPITLAQKRAAANFRDAYLANALSNPLTCVQAIANAYWHLALKEGCQHIDRTAVIIQAKLMALLRTQLSHGVRDVDCPDIALVICTITHFEIALGRTTTLTKHRDAMMRVVSRMGGVHNMRHAINLIYTFDRLISNFSSAPLCLPPTSHIRLRRPVQHPYVYGACFENFPCELPEHKAIIEYCLDTCRLIELLEGIGFSFNPAISTTPRSTDLHYLYYLREANMSDHIELSVMKARKEDIFRCMLMSAAIVSYSALHDNFIAMLPYCWADSIRPIIASHTFSQSPLNKNVIIWILFVLSTLRDGWAGKSWAVAELEARLIDKYGIEGWPADWKETELRNLHGFVWCDTSLQMPLQSLFEELECRIWSPLGFEGLSSS